MTFITYFNFPMFNFSKYTAPDTTAPLAPPLLKPWTLPL